MGFNSGFKGLTSALDGDGLLMPHLGRFTARSDPVLLVHEARWAPGPIWTGAENLASAGIQSPHRPAHSESLYRLSYPGCREIMENRSWNLDLESSSR